jgi:PleD family two-component response regulator
VTISVGVAVTAPGERFTCRDMFDRADTALDDATHSRRGRVAST